MNLMLSRQICHFEFDRRRLYPPSVNSVRFIVKASALPVQWPQMREPGTAKQTKLRISKWGVESGFLPICAGLDAGSPLTNHKVSKKQRSEGQS